ncbi:hypothetical protein B7486_56795 [cyanobacterium TDX16]|nr:hypothetical protein B7486_56795 [cyanobacterium TDX16]
MRTTTRGSVLAAVTLGARPRSAPVGITVYGCDPDEAALFEQIAAEHGVVPTTTSAPASATGVVRVPANRCVSVSHHQVVTGEVLRALRDAGADLLCTRSIGIDHIDLVAAEALGIEVANVRYAPDGVADHTVMLVLMALRGAKDTITAGVAADRWQGRRGRDLRDLTVGVVGVGRIGAAVVQRLRGFGCRVVACDAGRSAAAGLDRVPLDELLRSCDVVTLHVPLTPATRHLIGRAEIEQMKDGAVLVNTARGGLVDTVALVSALQRRKLGGAALDVLEGDVEVRQRLQEMPNAIVTPHVAYFTERTLGDTVRQTIERCLDHARSRADA